MLPCLCGAAIEPGPATALLLPTLPGTPEESPLPTPPPHRRSDRVSPLTRLTRCPAVMSPLSGRFGGRCILSPGWIDAS